MTIDSIRRIVKWRPIGESRPVEAGVLRAASVRGLPNENFARMQPFDRELPRFRVPVRSAFVAEVCDALDRAGVAAERSPNSSDGAEKVTAVVEAEDASTALRKVLVIVGPSRLVGPIERVRDSGRGD